MLKGRLDELEVQFEESTGEKLEQHNRLTLIQAIHKNLSDFQHVFY